jgi:hypothetical protein
MMRTTGGKVDAASRARNNVYEMDAIVDLSWRAYPSAALMAAGLALFLYGAEMLMTSIRISIWNLDRPVVWVRGFRAAIVGLAIVALGASWMWQQLWVLLLALAIGGEELLETSVILFALRRGQRLARGT